MRHRWFWMVSSALLLMACADVSAVEHAADAYVAPEEFELIEAETLNGFEEVQRVFEFSTDLPGPEACEAGRRSLAEWAGASPELWERASPGNHCRYQLFAVPNFPEVDFAAVDVKRPIDGIPSTTNSDLPDVVVFFSIDK